jgi:type IV pilus assembly protein PilW
LLKIKDKKGFTLVELLVTFFIIVLVLGASYITYINLLKSFKGESKQVESQIEKVIGLELLRLDLEHAGLGIGVDQPDLPIQWDGSVLTILSTLNNSNKSTYGWILVNCSTGSWPSDFVDNRETSNTNLVFLNASTREFVANLSSLTCPGSGVYLGFPVQNSVASGSANACSSQWCNIITYSLSSNQNISTCNPNTKNLVRKTGSGALNNGTGTPILSCVADFQVRFDLDTNGDNIADTLNTDTLPNTPNQLREQLKRINVYILMQEGKYDSKFNFTGNTTIDGITLNLPADYIHYRWKVIKISVKPMDL